MVREHERQSEREGKADAGVGYLQIGFEPLHSTHVVNTQAQHAHFVRTPVFLYKTHATLGSCWMNCHEMLCGHSCSPEDDSL